MCLQNLASNLFCFLGKGSNLGEGIGTSWRKPEPWQNQFSEAAQPAQRGPAEVVSAYNKQRGANGSLNTSAGLAYKLKQTQVSWSLKTSLPLGGQWEAARGAVNHSIPNGFTRQKLFL